MKEQRNFTTDLEILLERVGTHRVSIRGRAVTCGKEHCHKCGDVGGHGIYYYAQWRIAGQDKWGSLYLGKTLPKQYTHLLNKRKRKEQRAKTKS